jgi:anti-sigma factor (TIGR02949 family)
MTDIKANTKPPPGLDCMHVVQRLWDYLDGRVPDTEREQIVAHLAWCNACASHYRFEEGFLNAVGQLRRSNENYDALRAQILTKLRALGFGSDD